MAKDEVYQEAVNRIQQAQQKDATELDLSCMDLTELPPAIAFLSNL